MAKNIDFICIGAPKAATSTLFELLREHPEIYIPPEKEVPFFNDDEVYQKGWKWYMKTFFPNANNGQKIGTLTPQYMSGYKSNSSEQIADRIKKQLPQVKIIALLRHPIERSFSQHKMHKRYGFVTSSFDRSVNSLLKKNLNKERQRIDHSNMFLFASEYGRILSYYYNIFPKENILILYTNDLENDPRKALKDVFDFLDVSTDYTPKDINRHSHVGSGKARVAFLTPGFLKKHPVLNFLWKGVVPIKLRKRLFMRITRWNIKNDSSKLDSKGDAYKKLLSHFEKDVRLLEKVSGIKIPWNEWS